MKLLQVMNCATVLGGTGACGWSITKALPDWQHQVFFFGGAPADQELRAAFSGAEVLVATRLQREMLDDCDVAIFHNTHASRMPAAMPSDCLRVFYEHSAAKGNRESKSRCDLVLSVSKHLAGETGVDPRFVLYQPVPWPPRPDAVNIDTNIRIGRLCTPTKWHIQDADFYRPLANAHPDVYWEFVGCPVPLQSAFVAAVDGKVAFHSASQAARSLLWNWSGMLYHSPTRESYGRTACEAQQCGCLPIVDDYGGFSEQVIDREDGILVPEGGDWIEAIHAMKAVIKSPADRGAIMVSGCLRGSLAIWRERFLSLLSATAKSFA